MEGRTNKFVSRLPCSSARPEGCVSRFRLAGRPARDPVTTGICTGLNLAGSRQPPAIGDYLFLLRAVYNNGRVLLWTAHATRT